MSDPFPPFIGALNRCRHALMTGQPIPDNLKAKVKEQWHVVDEVISKGKMKPEKAGIGGGVSGSAEKGAGK